MRWLVVLALLSSCTAKTYTDRENHRGDTQSTYDVWEFEIISARDVAGQKMRVAVVNERHFADSVLETEGSDGLDDQTRKSIPVGSTKRITLDDFALKSIYSSDRTEIRALNGSKGVIANVTHVRSCPVTTTETEKTSIVGDSSKGIITIPKLKTVIVREFSTPACADPSDKHFKIAIAPSAASASAEVLAAQKKSAEEDAENVFKGKLNQRIQQLEIEFKKAASAVPFEPKTEIERAFCPKLAGMLRAAGINEVKFERREASRNEGKGYTEIRYDSSATLLPMNVKFADGDVSRAAALFHSIKPDTQGCVEVIPVSEVNGYSSDELGKVARELETIVHRNQNGVNYHRAMKDLGREED